MLVMCEEEDLGFLRQLTQYLEPGSRAPIIKVDEQIVGHEWQWGRALKIVLDRGRPQREVELISRAIAHGAHAKLCPIRAKSSQMGMILLVKLKLQRAERTAGISGPLTNGRTLRFSCELGP